MVVGVGLAVLLGRARHASAHRTATTTTTTTTARTTAAASFAVGISGGLLPCPSALVVLLGAISLHRVAFGMLLVVAFSVGLACTITAVGLVAVLAKRRSPRLRSSGRVVALLPAVSAA